jgi:hypothetical protein
MKLRILSAVLSSFAIATAIVIEKRAEGGYVQLPSGSASFTVYSGCSAPGIEVILRLPNPALDGILTAHP